jgi:hypothetical protein
MHSPIKTCLNKEKQKGFHFLSFVFMDFSETGLFNGLHGIQISFFRPRSQSLRYALTAWRTAVTALGDGVIPLLHLIRSSPD